MKFSETKKVELTTHQAVSGKRLLNPIVTLIIAVAIVMFGQLPGGLLGYILLNKKVISSFTNDVVFTLGLSFLGMVLFIYLFVRFVEKRDFRSLGFYKRKWFKYYIKGFGFSCLMMTIIAIAIGGLGEYTFTTSGRIVGMKFLPLVLITIFGWVIQGASEEILTRGWLMTSLGAKTNIYLAIILNSSLFTALHILNPSVSYIALLNLFIFGVFASVYAIYEGGIWGICGFHAGWNWFQGNILGIEVSGNKPIGGSLVKLIPGDLKLISGGNFGIEASIITTMVLCIFSLYYIYNIKKNH